MNRKLTAAAAALVIVLTGCTTVERYLGRPSVRVDAVNIESLDSLGISFRCDYTVDNPYPAGVTAKSVSADIVFDDGIVAGVKSPAGFGLRARSESRNSVFFRIPYDRILELARAADENEVLTFTIDGGADLDLSEVPYLDEQTLHVPFSADFDIPVFKPRFRVASGRILMPSAGEVAEAFVSSGMNIFKAGVAAGRFILGQPVEGIDFDEVELDIEILFDLILENGGGADFEADIRKCAIDTDFGSLVRMKSTGDNSLMTASENRIGMSAVVNTLEFGAFIAGIAGGGAVNTSLQVESSLVFPDLSSVPPVPLDINIPFRSEGFKFETR